MCRAVCAGFSHLLRRPCLVCTDNTLWCLGATTSRPPTYNAYGDRWTPPQEGHFQHTTRLRVYNCTQERILDEEGLELDQEGRRIVWLLPDARQALRTAPPSLYSAADRR